MGTVEAIHVAPAAEAAMEAVNEVRAVAGRGLRGDRYFAGAGTFGGDVHERDGYDLTLVEAEAMEALARDYGVRLSPGEHRRNITTRGVALNHLVGERFRVGRAVCTGIRLCEPCSHLESLAGEGVREGLVHRGGLRTNVVESGAVRVGDAVARV